MSDTIVMVSLEKKEPEPTVEEKAEKSSGPSPSLPGPILCPCGDQQGPCLLVCDSCGGQKVWTIVYTSTATFGLAWFFCFVCTFTLLSIFPFFSDLFRQYKHICPLCEKTLKVVKKKLTCPHLCFILLLLGMLSLWALWFLHMFAKYIGVI